MLQRKWMAWVGRGSQRCSGGYLACLHAMAEVRAQKGSTDPTSAPRGSPHSRRGGDVCFDPSSVEGGLGWGGGGYLTKRCIVIGPVTVTFERFQAWVGARCCCFQVTGPDPLALTHAWRRRARRRANNTSQSPVCLQFPLLVSNIRQHEFNSKQPNYVQQSGKWRKEGAPEEPGPPWTLRNEPSRGRIR